MNKINQPLVVLALHYLLGEIRVFPHCNWSSLKHLLGGFRKAQDRRFGSPADIVRGLDLFVCVGVHRRGKYFRFSGHLIIKQWDRRLVLNDRWLRAKENDEFPPKPSRDR